MSSRLIILIAIIVGGVGLIAAILYFLFRGSPVAQPPSAQAPAQEAVNANLPEPAPLVNQPETVVQPPANQKELQLQEEIKRLGIMFAERFGSYSNQGNFSNITDLYPVMTNSMKNWAPTYIEKLRSTFTGQGYQGVTTRVISSALKVFDPDAGKIELALTTQREEATGSSANTAVYYQVINLTFDQEDSLWKVNGAFWEQK